MVKLIAFSLLLSVAIIASGCGNGSGTAPSNGGNGLPSQYNTGAS